MTRQRLTPATAFLLTVPPITLNFLRWVLAFALLLPFALAVWRPGSALWPHWRRYSLLGLLAARDPCRTLRSREARRGVRT